MHCCYVHIDFQNINCKEHYNKIQYVPCSERVHCIILLLNPVAYDRSDSASARHLTMRCSVYSLHKSLSQEEHLRDEFNATLEAAESELRQREAAVEQQRRVNAQLTQQLKASVAAKMKMAEEVAKAVQAQKAVEANNER